MGAPEWGWAWPANRRILYNRASADPDGKPWSERKKYVWWDEEKQQWTGARRARLHQGSAAVLSAARGASGIATISGIDPFIMKADGKGLDLRAQRLADGPLPTHYEPQESVDRESAVRAAVQSGRGMEWRRRDNRYQPAG